MSAVESLFPTALQAADRYYAWRMMPWWTGESRECRKRSLLRLLALAHKDRLDLVPLLNNYANEQIGLYRLRVQRLARRVADGTPIVEALEQTPEVIGDELVLTIRFAAQTGTLSETYEELLSPRESTADQPHMKLQHAIIYAVVSLIMIACVVTFLALFIFPMLSGVFNEFGFDLSSAPFAFALLMTIWDHIVNNGMIYIFAIVVIAFLFWAAPSRQILRKFVPKWFRDPLQSRTSEVLQL
ncbi:MAG: type II secretion system F family protein, partial [Planctomycetota bacterium]